MEQLLGLIGYPLSHSFSGDYFRDKFEKEGISGYRYDLFPLEDVRHFPELLRAHPQLHGINVTIPHKVSIIPFLDELDATARAIGAVNTIRIQEEKLIGYNTDAYGFQHSLQPLLRPWHKKALILGTGGASRAILHVLQQLAIQPLFVSRKPSGGQLPYEQLNADILAAHLLIINCSPLGTFPKVDQCPAIPYEALSEQHLLYDLVYNPAETLFMKKGKEKGAATINGLQMLQLQAEKAWEIWTAENGRFPCG